MIHRWSKYKLERIPSRYQTQIRQQCSKIDTCVFTQCKREMDYQEEGSGYCECLFVKVGRNEDCCYIVEVIVLIGLKPVRNACKVVKLPWQLELRRSV